MRKQSLFQKNSFKVVSVTSYIRKAYSIFNFITSGINAVLILLKEKRNSLKRDT